MRKIAIIPIVLIIVILLLVGCGGRNAPSAESDDATSNSSSASNAAPAIATMPPAQFTSVGQQSTAGQQSVTNTVSVSTSVAASETVQTNAPDLARGALAYEKNKCADCHGAQGEGVADKGNAIAGTALTLSEFENKLRTGGGLGNSHIFGPSAVSRSGMEILYLYVQSLDD